jgi:argininosuccinate lyase
MKLWQKEEGEAGEWSRIVETFTVGRDLEFDILLAEHDVLGSLAHTHMLASIGLLTTEELASIHSGLHSILEDIRAGRFALEPGVEDVHSQVELQLTRSIGETGKKIHSGRSRNDQVLLDIKLFLRASLRQTATRIQALFERLQALSEKHRERLLPGYTHFQIAMPSSFGLWFGAYAESLCDDMEMLLAAFRIADKNPLGSGAGYGSSFPLQRKMTTEWLGFSDLNYNVVYAQMTRGKTEKAVAMALSSVAATLSKLAYDVCLYMNQNFGFITFPDALTTGSSIMPHKKNPDVFELVRAKCNRIQALPNELTLLTNNLPSGYHRDMQLSKEILFPAIAEMDNCLEMTEFMLRHIIVKDGILDDEKYLHIFSVEAVNELVLAGVPFRDAYRQVGHAIEKGEFSAPAQLHHTHEGSIGRLCNEEIRARMEGLMKSLSFPGGQEHSSGA